VSAVTEAMTPDNNHTTRSIPPHARAIAAPCASDALTGVFRAAFGPTDDTPDDLRALLVRLDLCEPGKH
jgi:hypothetical protein